MGSIPGCGWVQSYQRRLKMGVVSSCMVLTMKEGPRNITEKHDLLQSGKSSLTSWPDVKLIAQTNKQLPLLIVKGLDRGYPPLTKWFYSRLLLGPVIPKTIKMGVVPACMVLMMKWGPRNVTGQPHKQTKI